MSIKALNIAMKIIFAVFLCGLLVAAKAEEPVETEYEDPEDELNDLAELDFDDVDEKPANWQVSGLNSEIPRILIRNILYAMF